MKSYYSIFRLLLLATCVSLKVVYILGDLEKERREAFIQVS